MTPLLLSWSGGKDAARALHVLRQRDDEEVIGLDTTVTEALERISMQRITAEILAVQSQAVGLPVVQARLPQRADNAAYESVFATALEDARSRWPDLCDIAFGDITELLNALPPRIDPCGEHGEFHTCVSDGPMFTAPINITRGDTVLRDERFAYTDFELVTSGSPATLRAA